ncbi:MAG: 2,3-diphosphoglycerate-dependent phosphoglycerate mutase [Patescibacteria group bacterium]
MEKTNRKIVLIRHGESVWNAENRFTGWEDVDISPQGLSETKRASRLLAEGGFMFDVAFTSVLKRAIRTLWVILDDLNLMWIPVYSSWHLNERHYGILQGLNKDEVKKQYGEEQFNLWRRSYNSAPPALSPEDPRSPSKDPRYEGVEKGKLPLTESLKDTVNRFIPYWESDIIPYIVKGEHVLIVAHGNLLRALIKHLDGISDSDIINLNIATGTPLVYELTETGEAITHYYLE